MQVKTERGQQQEALLLILGLGATMSEKRSNAGAWKNNEGRKKLVEIIDEECGKRARRRKA